MTELLNFLIGELVSKKDEFKVSVEGDNVVISVAKEDMGKVIGRQGRIAKAIRTIVKAVSSKEGCRYNVEIVENEAASAE